MNHAATELDGTERPLSRKDYQTDNDVRWCPGCGDYAVLAQFHKMLAVIGARKEEHVIVSGIGCSSRFPYYVDCYGIHSIHGRAPAIATGLKLANPDLTVWVVTGDGDGLSIGASHLLHALRRNVDVKVLLFNNRIYGLTKGQFSPTSPSGLPTRSSPGGNPDSPVHPLDFAMTAGASFVARAIDTDTTRLQAVLLAAAAHRGSVFVEILQNCPIFLDGAFDALKPAQRRIDLVDGEPMQFGGGVVGRNARGRLEALGAGDDRVLVHDVGDRDTARQLAAIDEASDLPAPFGVIYRRTRSLHHEIVAPKKRRLDIASMQRRLATSAPTA